MKNGGVMGKGLVMGEFFGVIRLSFAVLGGWLGWFLGGWGGSLYALVLFITIDYVTGVMCAVVDRELSSEIGAKGIMGKAVILMLVGVGALLDRYVVKSGEVARTAVIFYYISNEGISILENATRLGLPVPEKLREMLEQIKKDEKDEKDKEGDLDDGD